MDNEIKQLISLTKSVDGWLSVKEGLVLYNLAKNCTGKGVIVEIGSWKGKSTIWLASGSKSSSKTKVYAIDPHKGSSEHVRKFGYVDTYEDFVINIKMAGLEDTVVPIRDTSMNALKLIKNPVELIFIDGAHEHEMVRADFEAWFPELIKGGVMALHDSTTYEGPIKVSEDFLYKSKHFKNVKTIDSITFGVKVENNSLKDRIYNMKNLIIKRIRFFIARNLPLHRNLKLFGRKIFNLLNK